ncbi:MAG: hypothetical protein IT198_16565 [Acidimicrobiia bacterium]|nr:hypothetical protein [Acidimicrobiia bacterium]
MPGRRPVSARTIGAIMCLLAALPGCQLLDKAQGPRFRHSEFDTAICDTMTRADVARLFDVDVGLVLEGRVSDEWDDDDLQKRCEWYIGTHEEKSGAVFISSYARTEMSGSDCTSAAESTPTGATVTMVPGIGDNTSLHVWDHTTRDEHVPAMEFEDGMLLLTELADRCVGIAWTRSPDAEAGAPPARDRFVDLARTAVGRLPAMHETDGATQPPTT